MISFKQYLAEARMAPLYHGTTLTRFINMSSNGIAPNTVAHINNKIVKGISTSRNKKFSMNWAINKFNDIGFVLLTFDQLKLTNRYKITPYNFWQDNARRMGDAGNEFEEYIVTNKNITLDYVTAVDYYTIKPKYELLENLRAIQRKYPHIKFTALGPITID